MAEMSGIPFALAVICFCLSDFAVGQSGSSTTSESSTNTSSGVTGPVSCQNANAFTANGTLLLGTWYEAARKPVAGTANTEECVQLEITASSGHVSIQSTYSSDTTPWNNQTTTLNFTYDVPSGNGSEEIFPAEFNTIVNKQNVTLKIVSTDYTNYAYVCGYLTSSTNATSNGAFILTRQRELPSASLSNLIATALQGYSDFSDLAKVTQSNKCYESGAGTSVPALALVMALVYGLLKFMH